jgi:hypothetical protein
LRDGFTYAAGPGVMGIADTQYQVLFGCGREQLQLGIHLAFEPFGVLAAVAVAAVR